ncbi:hypothetical protein BaRGS_00027550 [Batillaria attramentaria]|uniref:C2H2-type domain-containing protein n=1 Tax=Batillaria attramentaria TaxID=370345 RepID=A0ABD0K2T3_9CAEN
MSGVVVIDGSEQTMRGHAQTVSEVGLDNFTCRHCHATFPHWPDWKTHTTTCHARPWPCPQCPLTFTSQTMLRTHKRVYHDNIPYKCTLCGQEFRTNGGLTAHRNAKHGQHAGLVCNICGKTFAHRQHKKYHMARAHKGESEDSFY